LHRHARTNGDKSPSADQIVVQQFGHLRRAFQRGVEQSAMFGGDLIFQTCLTLQLLAMDDAWAQ
jgi:hypothetical protein